MALQKIDDGLFTRDGGREEFDDGLFTGFGLYVGNSCHKAVCQYGCKNGGECVAPNKCVCRSGFSGKDCSQAHCDPEIFVKNLFASPECQNGGVCVGKGKCSCVRGYTGYSCEKAYCPGNCLNGGKCGKTGKCSCPLGYTGSHCEIKKPCKFVEIKEPYKRGYKQKVTTQAKVPCGAWGWKSCTKTKVHYEMVYKTFYKTSYECEGIQKNYPDYQKLKNG
ncbi:EGF-like domain-containing protein [Caerostris extrusa]|uniref:EGF-like domain-containing protein n=1 Tax=Caerostris extrusa TaxID=172846 RepID=A0AAV4Y3L5_CAEEX|nr:EGF-like domain-containing protein [Caerostris extrusa]